ncbi:molybdopterin-dependent oxidoreductase [Falsirhodobacter halotolerans]|uniref:molybdopterin-dependent oxidoreductase n=1 Tax=Falsirhodobacter halotolerans TaxID=1146892 RepID=UPI001FD2FDE1|nr:molybdopterin-dependent oxidoreductase [Falsirhodobacter halotolerans]MCJ8138276.1 molybdopterin-dependent oxidoreductase [Falsirhodobacter halotolerans]
MLKRAANPVVATHWGLYRAEMDGNRPQALVPIAADPDPSPLSEAMIAALDAPSRIRRPAVRQGFLRRIERGGPPGSPNARGQEPFVELPWDEALDIAAAELGRVRAAYGNGAIYGGSYGWGSAGRFHHAQSQVHRFLNSIGGYTRSVQNYSFAAASAIVPRILGTHDGLVEGHTSWARIAEHTETVLMFGGVPRRNAQVSSGGVGRHIVEEHLKALRQRGARLISASPVRSDTEGGGVEWLPVRPGTDTALMLGMAHVLIEDGLVDRDFLDRCTTGYEVLRDYVMGCSGGPARTPQWAEAICGVRADRMRDLARHLSATRSFIMVAWSLQRADHGEQPYWMAMALAAMLGQVGLPGGGFGYGYASANGIGQAPMPFRFPALSQLANGVDDYIPVARITDALETPGGAYHFDGQRRTYPDIRLVYWAGGNPFHHHQDLNRLRRAWQRPETVIVHEGWWNPLARHADIVFPVTTPLERNDIAASARDHFIAASHAVATPAHEARNDYDIFSALAARLGAEQDFTAGRDEEAWLRHLYAEAGERASAVGITLPPFDAFWKDGILMIDPAPSEYTRDLLADFRADPEGAPLQTPSGRLEIFSKTIADFGYDDCPGHPAWLAPKEWLGAPMAATYGLHLLSNQPRHRLHSQYDMAGPSVAAKRHGRETIWLHPIDAASRGLAEGAPVRVFNDRGACLAILAMDDAMLPGVAVLPTGAWYDPVPSGAGDADAPLEVHGNPNVLTADRGTSKLAQGCSAQSCLVEVEPWRRPLPPVRAFLPPDFVPRA